MIVRAEKLSKGGAVALAAALALGLAGCKDITEVIGPIVPPGAKVSSAAIKTKPAHRWTCPPTLSHVAEWLVTPKSQWEGFLGEGVMDRTLNRPIDVMIKEGGGYEPSVNSGRKYVYYYEEILANRDKVAEEYRGFGKSDEWIATYLMTIKDGVTINQAFVDAVECRRANGWLEASATTAPAKGGTPAAPLPPPPEPAP